MNYTDNDSEKDKIDNANLVGYLQNSIDPLIFEYPVFCDKTNSKFHVRSRFVCPSTRILKIFDEENIGYIKDGLKIIGDQEYDQIVCTFKVSVSKNKLGKLKVLTNLNKNPILERYSSEVKDAIERIHKEIKENDPELQKYLQERKDQLSALLEPKDLP